MSTSPARWAAAEALWEAARRFPDLAPPRLQLDHLSSADAALAVAIYRTAVQRWLTLEYLLDKAARLPMSKTDPRVRAALLTGAAQLVFLPGVQDYAAVDESVMLVRKLDRPNAAGAVNAVLRKVAAMVGQRSDQPWAPARDALPLETGTLKLTGPLLPKTDNLLQYLAAATSHPLELVKHWHKQLGPRDMQAICLHDLSDPPTFVFDEHNQPRIWDDKREQLIAYLAEDSRRRVQDPTAAAVVASLADLTPSPQRILDYCAGQGTKTRQLAALFPAAEITATDVNPQRLEQLRGCYEFSKKVITAPAEDVLAEGRGYDLVLLDVPCSNSGVFARRAEARYRFSGRSVDELVALQRRIVEQVAPRIEPGGTLLYATCSIEPAENQQQAAWIAERYEATLQHEQATLPGGRGPTYHDGGYFARLRWPMKG